MPTRSPIDHYLPLKPVVFHILLALKEEGESYGYGIIQAVRRRSQGRVPLPTGAFYRHLRRLLDDGLVAETGGAPQDDDPRRGAYYRLTGLGRRVVEADLHRMADLVRTAIEPQSRVRPGARPV